MRVACANTDAPVWRVRLSPDQGKEEIVISAAALAALEAIVADAAASERCRALVLAGEAGQFCRGMDLGLAAAGGAAEGVHGFARALGALRRCPLPVIALVDGEVVAGGVGLAAAADIVIASERSSFACPEVVLGLVPAIVIPLLLERMPQQKVRKMVITGSPLDAPEALACGLVDELAAPERLERTLSRQLRQLLRTHPDALATAKRQCGEAARAPLEEALAAGADCTGQMLASGETVAAIRAFIEGEPLPWFDRYRPQGRVGEDAR